MNRLSFRSGQISVSVLKNRLQEGVYFLSVLSPLLFDDLFFQLKVVLSGFHGSYFYSSSRCIVLSTIAT